MGKTHQSRVINITCRHDDMTTTPPTYLTGKYQYKFPRDDMQSALVAKAIAEFRSDNGLAAGAAVTYTISTQHGK